MLVFQGVTERSSHRINQTHTVVGSEIRLKYFTYQLVSRISEPSMGYHPWEWCIYPYEWLMFIFCLWVFMER